ncbi:MAG: radical SAM protein [candidate division KSB1 bacterium]|nr:radical SAM protein [candidate division KSB1 bacterium]
MRLLLINPRFPESFWSYKWAIDQVIPNKRTVNPPLGLATLAALCPEDWQIEIVDENIESIPLNPQADIVGVCGMGVQFPRQKELLQYYRKKGYTTVAGGSYASLCPELYEDLADTVVVGEAEYIWKEFCHDFARGRAKKLYQETGEVSLHDSPTPRFDLLQLDKYQSVSLQFSRGCPYRCEFCDIIVMFGRKPRTKTMEQVGKELDLLRQRGVHKVFFVDDNLIGNKPVAKELLRFLYEYQQRHHYTFQFGTEASLNLAYDDELLHLFRKANFGWVFIGIESPDEASLKETKKFQNVKEDIFSSVKKIYANGIDILAGFIIGFDNDTMKTFDLQYNFIMETGIQAAMVGLLTAPPKTPLYIRLQKQGRLRTDIEHYDNTKLGTNVIPKQMDYNAMIKAYQALYFRLLENRNIAYRVRRKLQLLKNPLINKSYSLREIAHILFRFVFKGLMPGGISRIYHFLRSLPLTSVAKMQMAIQDWILALAMRNYIDRHFQYEEVEDRLDDVLRSYLARVEKAFQRYLKSGDLEISIQHARNTASNLLISLRGHLDRPFFKRSVRHLNAVLKHSAASITLNIETLHDHQVKHLQRMLKRLSQYGDRISIRIHEALLDKIHIDSSMFNLVLVT